MVIDDPAQAVKLKMAAVQQHDLELLSLAGLRMHLGSTSLASADVGTAGHRLTIVAPRLIVDNMAPTVQLKMTAL